MAKFKINKNGNYIEVLITENGSKWITLNKKAKASLVENLELKGFRKGHIPENIAEQKISQNQIWNKAADMLIDVEYKAAIELLMKEKIATKPTFIINAISSESVEAVLRSVAMPKIKIGDRSGIKIKYVVEKVKDEEVKGEVSQLELMLQKSVDSKDKIIAKNGDTINIDFLGKVDGIKFEGGESKGFDLKLGSKSFIDGFESQVEGMKIGEEKNIKVIFPEQYPEKKLANKEAIFTVKLNAIKEIINLEGEELKEKLKSFGFNSKEEIVLRIKKVIADKKIKEADDKYFREYIDAIIALKDTKITLPEEILSQEIEDEFKRIEAQILQQGMNMKDYFKMLGMSADEFKKNTLKESSIKRVSDGLIYSQLIEEFKIKATEKDFTAEYERIAKDSKSNIEEVKKQVNMPSAESNILYKKLINLIK